MGSEMCIRDSPYPVLLDEEEQVSGDLRVAGFPTLLILNRKGEVSYLRAGIVGEKRLRELLSLAGAQLPETASGTPAAAAVSKPAAAPPNGPPPKPVPAGTKAAEGPSRP